MSLQIYITVIILNYC